MFANLEALDSVKHRTLRLKPQGFDFAATVMTVPLSATEFVEAAKHFPIVFPMDNCVPQALLSLKNGPNSVIGADGQWTAAYIPAHLRRHPFILSRAEGEAQATVLIDRSAASLSEDEGERLFDDEGAQSPLLTRIIAFLSQFQAESELTEAVLKPLDEVLVARQIDVEVAGQPKQSLNGFRAVDMDKLNAVADETFLAWRKTGLLALIHAHLASMTNVQRLAELQAKA